MCSESDQNGSVEVTKPCKGRVLGLRSIMCQVNLGRDVATQMKVFPDIKCNVSKYSHQQLSTTGLFIHELIHSMAFHTFVICL